ncbi:Serine/threonine-protein kinase PrkC [Gemmata obscuriglobus]|nr:serine/threonine-protein kinase [Gemmata obscuriglobus]QEG26318.1 Serine/threonine-protein kinase PrkC [Gemmata obscuriglobus]VTS01243.1 serine threonine protein kinase : Putative serine/threonine protein kinase OS=Gemmata sp. Wa1-1 PE=3 SV=1: Pkinase [Gemmata obscuriglobus UQM 2246]
MGTPTEPPGRPSSANHAAPVPPSAGGPGAEVPPLSGGSTSAHQPNNSLSDLILNGSSVRARSAGSDIAKFLTQPQVGAANTDDAPTIITKNGDKTPLTPPPPPLPLAGSEPPSVAGRRLGHFELIEAIGAGGMAAVLKARDLELGRVVALKILPPEAARDLESVTRFKQEARSAAKLDHENIARVYFCGEDQGLHFIAFEFVEGENLRVLIDRRGRLPKAECVRYMIQVAAGLNHAAERGVVHRDIKPSNILITPDGRAKIVDMGLARYLGSELSNGGVTQSGVTLGTFDYISPEQALDPRRADVRSDIYSLGCTFYHALTGRPPVPEGTAARKLRAHQEDDFLDPRELNPGIPDELAAVLARMVMKDPSARYQTPTELIAHLKGLAEQLNIADAVANDPAAQAVPADKQMLPGVPTIRPWWVLAVVAVAAAVVAFVVSTADPGRAPGIQPPPESAAKAPEPVAGTKGGPVLAPAAEAGGVVRTVEELEKRLAAPATDKVVVVLAPVSFDLSKLAQPVAFQGTSLELVGTPDGQGRGPRLMLPPGALSIKAQTVTVRGVWVVCTAPSREWPADSERAAWAGLRLEDAERVELTECVFRSAPGAPDELFPGQAGGASTVSVTRSPDGRAPRVSLARCLFGPGAVALTLPAGSTAAAADCGFAPHTAVVQFDAPGEAGGRSEAQFDRCSFMLNPGGAATEATGDLTVRAEDCVFAPVYGPSLFPTSVFEDQPVRGAVIRVRGVTFRGVQLVLPAGRASAFYAVNPVRGADRTLSFDECRGVTGLSVEDKGKVELRERPWDKANPDPAALTTGPSPWSAFKLGFGAEPALFTSDKRRPEPRGAAFNDAERHDLLAWRHRAYPDLKIWPPARPLSAAEVTEKVWHPDAKPEDLRPGEFTDLRALLRAARPDDVILIQHTGDLRVDNEELKTATKSNGGELRVTFRPKKGFAPVLVIQGDMDRDQSLFKLKSGEVTFEDLTFRLTPKEGQTVAAVAVIGGKGCTFRRCAFTLAEEDDSKATAVHLPDPEKVMKMGPTARAVPKVVFERCVIRGRGRAVWIEVSRPLTLELTDTLTALDGPVVLAQAGGEGGTGTGTSSARLTRVTALTGGPVVELRGGKSTDLMRSSSLTKLEVETDNCLFVDVPGAGRPLVEIEGVEPTDWKSVLSWRVPAKPNRYANFDPAAVVAQIRAGADGSVKEWGWNDWANNVGEPLSARGVRLGKVKFAAAPAGLKELSTVRPADLAVESVVFPDPADKVTGGADPKVLPALPEEPKPE